MTRYMNEQFRRGVIIWFEVQRSSIVVVWSHHGSIMAERVIVVPADGDGDDYDDDDDSLRFPEP